jgi:hypothetical protein
VCVFKLASKFIRVKAVEEGTAIDMKKLAEIEKKMKQISAALAEEPTLTDHLLPALRKLQQQKTKLIGEPNVVHESIDPHVITDLMNDDADYDRRLRIRDLAAQTIKQIKLNKIENTNWYVMVSGTITTTDGKSVPFRYAYGTRRVGFILCDVKEPNRQREGSCGFPVFAETITDDVKAMLNRFPLRSEVAKNPALQRQISLTKS